MSFATPAKTNLEDVFACLQDQSVISWNKSFADTLEIIIEYQHGDLGKSYMRLYSSEPIEMYSVDPDEQDCVDMVNQVTIYESWFSIRYSPFICHEQILELERLASCFDGVVIHDCFIYTKDTINTLVGGE